MQQLILTPKQVELLKRILIDADQNSDLIEEAIEDENLDESYKQEFDNLVEEVGRL